MTKKRIAKASASQGALIDDAREMPRIVKQMLEHGVPTPREEYFFAKHVGRDWRFDYAWPGFMVAYEYEGATWAGGRHAGGAGFDADAEKYNRAAILGWRVIRGTSSTERKGLAITDIVAALKAAGWKEAGCHV